MDELEDFDEELRENLEGAEKALSKISKENLQGRERATKIEYVHSRLKRCKVLVKSMKLELRDLSRMEADPWKKTIARHEESIQKLSTQLDFAEEHNELTEGRKKKRTDPDAMTADELLQKADAIQDDDLDRADGMIRTIEQTKEIGTNIGQELDRQTGQLKKASEHVKEIESNMDMANRELRSFVRRMATDKLIMVFLCCIVLGVAGIIVYAIIEDKTAKTPDQYGNSTDSDASKA